MIEIHRSVLGWNLPFLQRQKYNRISTLNMNVYCYCLVFPRKKKWFLV